MGKAARLDTGRRRSAKTPQQDFHDALARALNGKPLTEENVTAYLNCVAGTTADGFRLEAQSGADGVMRYQVVRLQ